MPAPLPLVAREQVLRDLWLQVAASADSGMRAAVVRGPAGSGKTRVLDAFAERARAAGATVVAGRAPSLGGHPYATLADAFAAYVRSSAPAGGQVRRAGEALAGLVPALVALDGARAPGGLPDAMSVVQAAYRFTRQVTERRPLVIGVDDAHLADSDSCEVLAALVRHAADLPWTLVLAWRDPSDEVLPAARRLLEVIRRERECLELVLEPLDLGAAGQLVAAILGEGLPSPSLVEMVHARSAGNPYYLLEMVRWLRDSGRLRRTGLQWVAVSGAGEELPPTVEAALCERTAALSRDARNVLRWVATAGGGADLRLLAETTGLAAEPLATALAVLVTSGFLAEAGGRRAEYVVNHPLVGECVYREMTVAQRRLRHRSLARALAGRGESPGAVAVHHVRAADPGDAEAIAAALAAGAEAEARTNLSQAVAWYEEVLQLASETDEVARLQALDRISELAGHAGRNDLGFAAVDELLSRTPPSDRLRRFVLLRRLASLRVQDGDTRAARAAIEEALSLGASAGPEAALLLAELAMVAQFTMSVPEVLQIVARGFRAARNSGAVGAALVLGAFEALAVSDSGSPHRALELATTTAEQAMDADEVIGFGYAVFASAVINLQLGHFRAAETSLRSLLELSEQVGSVWGAAWLWTLLGENQLYLGKLDEALLSCLRAEELGRRPGAASVMPMPVIFTGAVLVAQGRLDEAEDRLEDARVWLEDRPNGFFLAWRLYVLGSLHMAHGRFEEAVSAYAAMAAEFDARGHQTSFFRAELAHALVAAGRAREALRVARGVFKAARGRAVPLDMAAGSAAVARALTACGRHATAVAEARRAVTLAAGVDGEVINARARAVLGEALLRAGEVAEARDVLIDAHRRLAGIPLAAEREAARDLLVELGAAPPAPVAVPGRPEATLMGPLEGLSRREREVAALAATGLSSRSIALRLGISERTVENHLQRTYAKLDLHSRAELIALLAGRDAAALGGYVQTRTADSLAQQRKSRAS